MSLEVPDDLDRTNLELNGIELLGRRQTINHPLRPIGGAALEDACLTPANSSAGSPLVSSDILDQSNH